jgi:hypothetical protein
MHTSKSWEIFTEILEILEIQKKGGKYYDCISAQVVFQKAINCSKKNWQKKVIWIFKTLLVLKDFFLVENGSTFRRYNLCTCTRYGSLWQTWFVSKSWCVTLCGDPSSSSLDNLYQSPFYIHFIWEGKPAEIRVWRGLKSYSAMQ